MPTNLEMVEMADTIIIGKVQGLLKHRIYGHDILVKPTTLLKGNPLPKAITLDGWLNGERVSMGNAKYRNICSKLVVKINAQQDAYYKQYDMWISDQNIKNNELKSINVWFISIFSIFGALTLISFLIYRFFFNAQRR